MTLSTHPLLRNLLKLLRSIDLAVVIVVVVVDFYLSDMPEDLHILHKIQIFQVDWPGHRWPIGH